MVTGRDHDPNASVDECVVSTASKYRLDLF